MTLAADSVAPVAATAFAGELLSRRESDRPSPLRERTGPAARKRRLTILVVLVLALLLPLAAPAQVATNAAPLQFTDQAEAERFHDLVAELRCVMCQNQTLADSNAQIAQDLRREVLTLMREGKSDAQVKQFLVARYGEFVLYRPQVQSRTWLLWFGPAVLLLAGGFVIAAAVRKRGARAGTAVGDDNDQEW